MVEGITQTITKVTEILCVAAEDGLLVTNERMAVMMEIYEHIDPKPSLPEFLTVLEW